MPQRLTLSVVAHVDAIEIEAVLWAACASECLAVGSRALTSIASAVAYNVSTELELDDALARDAAVELVACAALVKALAGAHGTFTLRERRLPSAHELLCEIVDFEETLVRDSYALARCFLAQQSVC